MTTNTTNNEPLGGDDLPISMSTNGSLEECEKERARRASQQAGAAGASEKLPKWIDDLKGRDPLIDDLIGYILDLIKLDNEKIADLRTQLARQRQCGPIEVERADFEDWFTARFPEPLQSRECARMWSAWIARAPGYYKAREDWKISPQPWGPSEAFPPSAQQEQGDAVRDALAGMRRARNLIDSGYPEAARNCLEDQIETLRATNNGKEQQ